MRIHKQRDSLIARKFILLTGLLMFASHVILVKETRAIFNCLSSMSKKGYPNQLATQTLARPGPSNWYPVNPFMGQQPNSMSSLFGSKWLNQKPSFGKSWNWKFGNNFYRPGLGYGGTSQMNPISDYPNIYPNPSSYAPPGGWSVPLSIDGQEYIEQKTVSSRPTTMQTITGGDPYKPFSGINKWGTKSIPSSQISTNYISPTSSIDIINSNNKRLYGYSYPDWYSGIVESPAKIAHQLAKQGIKGSLRQVADQTNNRQLSSTSSFTILQEPRFVGFGSVQTVNNREAKLSCSFGESIDLKNKPLWVKFAGSYNATQVSNGKVKPPFNCANSQCRTQEIDTTKDFRFKQENGPATSTLTISEPRLADYGIYRCSALNVANGLNSIETLYQVIIFGA